MNEQIGGDPGLENSEEVTLRTMTFRILPWLKTTHPKGGGGLKY